MNKKIAVVLTAILCITMMGACEFTQKATQEVQEEMQEMMPGSTPASAPTESFAPEAFIGEDKAVQIALDKAGLTADDVVFDRTELDRDNGVYLYEIEFRQGKTEYEADISATDGAILAWKVDTDD